MSRDEVLRRVAEHRSELGALGIKSLALFGSIARGEASSKSDADMLVEFSRPVGLLHFAQVQRLLSRMLGCHVDLVTLDALKPSMRERVLAEAVHAA